MRRLAGTSLWQASACSHAQARPGIAFVEFENEAQAATSMQSLQNFKITPTNAIGISYAKQ